MKVTVVTPQMLDAVQINRWRSILLGNPDLASPYFCPEFTQSVASVRNDIYVGVIQEDKKITGFFPFQKISRRSAGPIGGPLSDYQGLIIEKGCEIEPGELVQQCGLKTWTYNHLITSQSVFHRYHEIRDVSYVIDLSGGLDNYLDEKKKSGSKLVNTIMRKRRKLEREIGSLNYVYHTVDEAVLQKLFEWKSQQYRNSGLLDAISIDWVRNLLNDIRSKQTEHFSGVLSALYTQDTLIAVHLGMRSNNVWHWWFPAYDIEYAKYSPGSILLMEMVMDTPEHNVNAIDLGKGDARYKDQFHNKKIELAEGAVTLSQYSGKVKALGQSMTNFIRRTPLVVPARIPARIIRRYRNWKKFS